LPEPPGRLIEANGHRLHLNCTGKGSPIVVYEAGASGSSLDWEKVQPTVAATTRNCSYDRAGYGWSEPSDAAKTTSKDIAEELHELLRIAGEGAPYILVGHSLGGFHLQMFAHLYPDEVVGAVLVDASHEDQFDWYQTYTSAVPSTGPGASDPEPKRTAEAAEIVRAMREDPKFAATQAREGAGILDSVALLREFDSLPNMLPLIVLTRGAEKQLEDDWTAFDLMWNRGQRNLASLSPRSTHMHVPGASHFIQLDRPDAVIASIVRIVALARESDAR
jgi:pimeloyl-ACP methyl ester carboxylesterase